MKVVIFGCFYLYVYMFIKFDIVGKQSKFLIFLYKCCVEQKSICLVKKYK